MRILKRADLDQIASNRSDIVTQEVEVPEWGVDAGVMLRVLTGTERSNYEAELMIQRGSDQIVNLRNAKVKLVALSIVDPDTLERLYTDNEVAILGQRSSAAIERIFDAAMVLNGMDNKQIKKIAQGLEKNPIA